MCSWCGKPAACARAGLLEANAEGWHFIFPYQFGICSECRGESDLGPCTTSGLLKRMRLCSADLRQILRPNIFFNQKSALRSRIPLARFLIGSQHCASIFFLQVQKLCTDLDLSLLYTLILATYTKFVWENKMLPCSSAARRFATLKSRLHFFRRIVSFSTTNSMKCDVNWIPLKIRVRLRNNQPYLHKLPHPTAP